MTLKRWFAAAGAVVAALVLALVRATAWCLARFPVGEMLESVSVPRLREQRGRTSLTVLGVSLGVAALVAVSLVNQSVLASFAATIDDIAGKTDLQVRAGTSGFDEDLFETVRTVPGVRRATRVMDQTVRLHDPRRGDERILLLGVDLLNAEDDAFRQYDSNDFAAIKADPLVFLNSPYNIILSRALAEQHGYRLRDKIELRTPSGVHAFTIWGFLGERGVGRAFGGAVALMDYAALQVAFDRGRNIDQLDIEVEPGAPLPAVAQRIRSLLGNGFSVERPSRRNEKVGKLLGSLSSGLSLASFVAVLVGMFLIYNTMAISVVQRRREIGALRALGMTRRQTLTLFTLEGCVLGAAGSALGVALGIGLAQAILKTFAETVSELFVQVAVSTVHVDLELVLTCFGLGVFATTLAAALPARKAAATSPVEALANTRQLPPPRASRRPWLDLLGIALFAASGLCLRLRTASGAPLGAAIACVTLVFGAALWLPRLVMLVRRCTSPLQRRLGIEMELAGDNLQRELGRVSATASALMVSVAMALAFASFASSFIGSTLTWVDQMLPADLWVTSAARMAGGQNVPMADELWDPLKTLPGVEFVERLRMDDIEYRGTPVKLVAMDTEVLGGRAQLTVLEGPSAREVREKLQAGAIALSENFARRFALHAGGSILLTGKAGMRRFEIAAVIVDYTSDLGSLLVDRRTYVAHWGDERVDSYKLYLHKHVDSEPLRRDILQRFGERYELFVLTNQEFRHQIGDVLEQTFGVMHLLELVAVVIAVFGVVNAVLANVLDRVRDLGMLRAIGMSRRQLKKMVVTEAALLGLVGCLAGVLLGFAIGYVLLEHINVAQTGWYLPYQPTLTQALTSSLPVLIAAAVAGWYPAQVAAELRITEALAYE